MSNKRSRAVFEADLQAKRSSFVFFGTPLPPKDPDVRDDGSYVPVWKQEVRDEKGLKRLHGAFTGGFSAGYYNTVGSKEGWTPSTFVSSRTNRKKDEPKASQQRPEDFMDDEDLADAEEAQKIQTADGFAGLGGTEEDTIRKGGLINLFRADGETMGVKLLKRMGWKEGQGIGPKVRRKVRGAQGNSRDGAEMHMFTPDNTQMMTLAKKTDHKGLGFKGDAKLSIDNGNDGKSDDEEDDDQSSVLVSRTSKKKKAARGGIGIGILNDTGSDDEDPYAIGPRISYNRVIGGDKKKKKPPSNGLNNALMKSKPVFISKRATLAKTSTNLRKCHDGYLPLDGFTLSTESLTTDASTTYPPPTIPPGWKSSKIPTSHAANTKYLSTSDAAKLSKLNPLARASLLGETSLPGKSVFDYLTTSSRERIVSSTGNSNIPEALGEIPSDYVPMTPLQHQRSLLSRVPTVEKSTAVAALSRAASGSGGFIPYNDNPAKRSRYLDYLSFSAGVSQAALKTPEESIICNAKVREEWLKELLEFKHCADIFRPVTGLMATRFTSSSSTTSAVPTTGTQGDNEPLLKKVEKTEKPEDPAEQAARLGMYGPMTRTVKTWYPTRLLCKRFNVKPPAHIYAAGGDKAHDAEEGNEDRATRPDDLVTKEKVEEMMGEFWDKRAGTEAGQQLTSDVVEAKEDVVIDVERNEALESRRAGEAVFKAVFGDDDDDDDSDEESH